MFRAILHSFCGLLFLALAACSSSPYTHLSKDIKTSLNEGSSFTPKEPKLKDPNYLIDMRMIGLYYFINNKPEQSIEYFTKANIALQTKQKTTQDKVSNSLKSTFLKGIVDSDYLGSEYEETLAHYYLGLAYLNKQSLKDASIEFRAVEDSQKYSQAQHEKKIAATEEAINKVLADNHTDKPKKLDKILNQAQSSRAKTFSAFANAESLYVAGIVRELNNEYNSALVNYKQAYQVLPNNKFLLEDLYRLSLIFDQSFALQLRKEHPDLAKANIANYTKQNTIYVLYDQGFIPPIKSQSIYFYFPNQIQAIHLPFYEESNEQPYPLKIAVSDYSNPEFIYQNSSGTIMTNILKLGQTNLTESYPVIILKELIRITTSGMALSVLSSSSSNSQGGVLLSAGLSLLYSASGSADTHQWSNLPHFMGIAKISSPQDISNLTIYSDASSIPVKISPKLKNGEVLLIYLFNSGKKTNVNVIYRKSKRS